MLKYTVLSLSLILVFGSCSFTAKKIIGLKHPKVQTNVSVSEYLVKSKIPYRYNFVLNPPTNILDSTETLSMMFKAMGGDLLVFDSAGVHYNYIGSSSCSGTTLAEAIQNLNENFTATPTDSFNLDSLLNQITPLDLISQNVKFIESDIYIVHYWGIYYGGKKRKQEDYLWVENLNTDSLKKVVILNINTDPNESWGLTKNDKFKIKFKLIKGREISMKLKWKNKAND